MTLLRMLKAHRELWLSDFTGEAALMILSATAHMLAAAALETAFALKASTSESHEGETHQSVRSQF